MQEEDRIIKKESIVLKDRIGAADITPVSEILSCSSL